MVKITNKDIKSFGKVLKVIGEALESNPGLIQTMIKSDNGKDKKGVKNGAIADYGERVNQLDLYSRAKELDLEGLINFLKEFGVDELKGIIKKYNLGYTKLRSVDSISKYIAEQLKKRTTDVFLQHEK